MLKSIKTIFTVALCIVAISAADVNFQPNQKSYEFSETIEVSGKSQSDLFNAFIQDLQPSIQSAGNLMWRMGDKDGIRQQDDGAKTFVVTRQSFDSKKVGGKRSCVLYTIKANFEDGKVSISFENLALSYQKTPMSTTMSTTDIDEYMPAQKEKVQSKALTQINEELNVILSKIKKKLS